MRHVVAITHPGKSYIRQPTLALEQRQVIGQRLAGMLEIGKAIDDWDSGVLGQLNCRLV
jgi:hypothetical protein